MPQVRPAKLAVQDHRSPGQVHCAREHMLRGEGLDGEGGLGKAVQGEG